MLHRESPLSTAAVTRAEAPLQVGMGGQLALPPLLP